MTLAYDDAPAQGLPAGSHVCWVVDDEAGYDTAAAGLLADGTALNQKLVAFGPEGSPSLAAVSAGAGAAITADPHAAFLGRGPLTPDTMFAMFREQVALARQEGYDGLRVMADMTWLLPAQPSTAAIVGFELLLDRVVGELGASVVCAYRSSAFDTEAITGALAVHPTRLGGVEPPQFRLVAGDDGTWRLSGEVDIAVGAAFAAALDAAVSGDRCVLDVGGLEFVDVAGMRQLAETAQRRGVTLELRRASKGLRRHWQVAGFDELAPQVRLGA